MLLPQKFGDFHIQVKPKLGERLGSCYARGVLVTESGWSLRSVAGSAQFKAALVERIQQSDGKRCSDSEHRLALALHDIFECPVLPPEHEPAGNPLR